jgi:hypothetical protein
MVSVLQAAIRMAWVISLVSVSSYAMTNQRLVLYDAPPGGAGRR